jgi:hypothetical protein
MIAARQSDGMVALATHSNGMFSATIGELAGVGGTVASASGATLDAPYPNPVRERASMRYTIAGPASVPVRLGLFDLSGHEVARLVDRARPAGEYTAELAVSGPSWAGLPSGRYYCRLEVGGRVAAVRAVSVVR